MREGGARRDLGRVPGGEGELSGDADGNVVGFEARR